MRTLSLLHITLLMVYRRKALWIASIPLALFALFLAYASPMSPGLNKIQGLVFTGQVLAIFTSLAYAASFSNLMTAGKRAGMDELESTSALPMAVIRLAQVLGAWGICISSSLFILVLIAVYQAFHGNGEAIIRALAVVLVILSPSILIATGISALLGALLPTVPARILAVLVWAWLAFHTPLLPLPTLNGGPLSVIGDPIAQGWFHTDPVYSPTNGAFTVQSGFLSLLWQGSIIVILFTGANMASNHIHVRSDRLLTLKGNSSHVYLH